MGQKPSKPEQEPQTETGRRIRDMIQSQLFQSAGEVNIPVDPLRDEIRRVMKRKQAKLEKDIEKTGDFILTIVTEAKDNFELQRKFTLSEQKDLLTEFLEIETDFKILCERDKRYFLPEEEVKKFKINQKNRKCLKICKIEFYH